MPSDRDAILLESVRVHRARLRAAFLHGELLHRRRTTDNVRGFVASTVLAAVLCAGCAGVSFLQANVGSLRGGTQVRDTSPLPSTSAPSSTTQPPGTSPAPHAAPADPDRAHR